MKFIDFDWEEYTNLSGKPKEETEGNDPRVAALVEADELHMFLQRYSNTNKCECGGSSVGDGLHSPWCPAFEGDKK